ncbi:MAG: ABC transporter ATP-binding protein [Acidovorax sp.]
MPASLLALQDLRFGWPGSAQACLDIAEFHVAAGETVFLHGPSGCGKSTLLSLMAGVLLPRVGDVALLGTHWGALRPSARDRYRVDHLGYIFQQFNLLPYLTALDNVLLPCRFSARRRDAAVRHAGSPAAAAEHWLKGMGLDAATWQRPANALSVGQQQRVAAARALIGQPELVIADEPTSALDEDRREVFLDLLLSACAAAGTALVLVSHDRRIAGRFARQVSLPEINRAAHHEEAMA